MSAAPEPDLIHVSSASSVPETMARLEAMAREAGLHAIRHALTARGPAPINGDSH